MFYLADNKEQKSHEVDTKEFKFKVNQMVYRVTDKHQLNTYKILESNREPDGRVRCACTYSNNKARRQMSSRFNSREYIPLTTNILETSLFNTPEAAIKARLEIERGKFKKLKTTIVSLA